MSSAVQAFVFTGSPDNQWKLSDPDQWNFDWVDIEGTEKVLGHHKIDGCICKVVLVSDGKLVAIPHS
jgi:hypothetical protein